MAKQERIMMISTHGYVAAEPELGKPDTGGQVAYVLEISRCLARMGYRVDILTRKFEDQPAKENVTDRVRVLRFPCGGDAFIPKEVLCEHIPEWVNNVTKFVKGKRLRYTFINSHYWDAGLAGQELAHRLNVPHIHTPHSIGAWKQNNMDGNPDELEDQYNFATPIREENVIYVGCDAVIATTGNQRDLVLAAPYEVPQDKVYVVPPGYDDGRFFPVSQAHRMALKEEYGFTEPIILALGRIARNKGYDLLIRAMPVVLDKIEDAKLLLPVGASSPNPEEQEIIDELKAIARELDIEDHIVYRGHIADEELADYYRLADVFALSSRYEPFGMTAVEAMACGTPAVITTEGGLVEHVTWGLDALFANPFDPEAFGHIMRMPLQYKQIFTQMARFGSQKARAQFTWMGIAQRILQILYGYRMGTRPKRPLDA